MKSTQNSKTNHNMLISRKKPQKTGMIIFSLIGFILFLTGGLVAAAALIDGVFNQVSTTTFVFVIAGIVAYKLGRYIMKRCAV